MPGFRNRVKELRRMRAGDLVPSENNWRLHTQEQRAALDGILSEVGFAGAIIGWIREDGRVGVIDGHMRQERDPEQVVPVLITDLTEAEANKLLLTYDPIGSMAGANKAQLAGLLGSVQTGSSALQKMMDELGRSSRAVAQQAAPVTPSLTCPRCNHEFTEAKEVA